MLPIGQQLWTKHLMSFKAVPAAAAGGDLQPRRDHEGSAEQGQRQRLVPRPQRFRPVDLGGVLGNRRGPISGVRGRSPRERLVPRPRSEAAEFDLSNSQGRGTRAHRRLVGAGPRPVGEAAPPVGERISRGAWSVKFRRRWPLFAAVPQARRAGVACLPACESRRSQRSPCSPSPRRAAATRRGNRWP